jgi:hypothetical protein
MEEMDVDDKNLAEICCDPLRVSDKDTEIFL